MLKVLTGAGFLSGVRFINTVKELQADTIKNRKTISDLDFPAISLVFDPARGINNKRDSEPVKLANDELALNFEAHHQNDVHRTWSLLHWKWYGSVRSAPKIVLCSRTARDRNIFGHLPNTQYLEERHQHLVDNLLSYLIQRDDETNELKTMIHVLGSVLKTHYGELRIVKGLADLHGIPISNSYDPLIKVAQEIVRGTES